MAPLFGVMSKMPWLWARNSPRSAQKRSPPLTVIAYGYCCALAMTS